MKLLVLILIVSSPLIGYGQIKRCEKEHYITIDEKQNSLTIITEPPKFPGGFEALTKFADVNLKHLAESDLSIKSVEFVIDTLGNIRNVCVVSNEVRKDLNEREHKIIDIIKSLPRWESAKNNLKNTDCTISIPLNK